MKKNYLLVICGPTAVGKTAISIELAKYFHAEIISADSRQLYREMSIGTAKPNHSEMDGVPHHMLDCISILESYNAGDYERDTIQLLDALFKKQNVVIMCGGTGLYIDAVCKGFDEGMTGNAQVKKEIQETYLKQGLAWLQEEVKNTDPQFYAQSDTQNPHRLMRALEVFLSTGQAYSSFRKNKWAERNFQVVKVFINEDRNTLYEKINKRVDHMMEQGLLKEAETLYPHRHLNALNTVGYKELFAYFEQTISLDQAVALIKQHSRNYAKRQITWFKNDEGCTRFEPTEIEKIKSFVEIVLQHS